MEKPEPEITEEEGRPLEMLSMSIEECRVSEILNGKRGIGKAQAKKLAEYFGVSAELFI